MRAMQLDQNFRRLFISKYLLADYKTNKILVKNQAQKSADLEVICYILPQLPGQRPETPLSVQFITKPGCRALVEPVLGPIKFLCDKDMKVDQCLFWFLILARIEKQQGKPTGDRTLKRSRQARSKGRALLFLASQQNLNPSYWHIWHTKNCQKQSRFEKVTTPQSRGGQELKKTNHRTLQHPLEFKDDLQNFRWSSYNLNRLK